jgi:environmental stress-induced protein Ves
MRHDLPSRHARRRQACNCRGAADPRYTSHVPRIIVPAEFRTQPWKNGGGVTHEIVRWPDSEPYDVRVSLADDRAPGPFSRFPGYRRWSFLAAGAPIALDIGGVVHELVTLGDHIEVDGDVAISCTLPAGPTRLLSFFVRDGISARIGRGPCPVPVRFAFALAGMPWLPAGHAAVFDPPAHATLERHAVWLA